RLEGRPESKEWPEREREEQTVALSDSGHGEHQFPTVEHPDPRLERVEPAQRLARGARRLMQTAVALARAGQSAAVGRMRALIVEQIVLRHQGQVLQM